MPSWLLLLAMGLSTWRLTRLVTEDDFPPVRWARDRIVGSGPEWLGDLVTCYWCASVWLAAGVVGLTDAFTSVPQPLLTFGAVAALSPILSVLVTRWDQPDDDPEGRAWIADQEPDDPPAPTLGVSPIRSEDEGEVTAQAAGAGRFPSLPARLEASPPPVATTRPYHGGLTELPEGEMATMVSLERQVGPNSHVRG